MAVEIERAEGIYMYGPDGKRYIDMVSGVSVSNTGHRHPKVIEAITSQLDHYLHLMVYGEFIQSPQVLFAEALCTLLPAEFNSVYFVNSGSEAIEGAMKLAKRYTGRPEIACFSNAYHGGTQGALSLIGSAVWQDAFRPLLPGIAQLKFNDIRDLERINSHTACVVIEPVQAEAGVILPQQNFLKALRKRCTETGALLVFDESQTAFGRTGTMFAFEQYNSSPDILVLSKALGGGMPLGAFIAPASIMQSLTHDPVLGHITTFGGHPVCCAAGLAALNVIQDEKLVETVNAKAGLFRERLQHHPKIINIRNAGLLMAIELGKDEEVNAFIHKGTGLGLFGDWFLFNASAFRIAPPLTITTDQVHECCDLVLRCLDEL